MPAVAVHPTKMIGRYLEVISLIERVHRSYLGLIAAELDQIGSKDINSVQALILLNIGSIKIAINEVRTRGNYLGSNMSYIIKNLLGNGYLLHERSPHDRRVVVIWLSDKGRALCDRLTEVHDRHVGSMLSEPGCHPDLDRTVWTLRQIEQFWIDRELET
jgi:DNA-binding MarR family transcriptional regulator